ncbi:MAG: DUF2177 family protein [Caldimonas sp.]
MTPTQAGLAYLAVLVAVAVLDAIWLGVLTKDLYRREMGSLMADSFRVVPAVLFYLLYPMALVYLVLWNQPAGWIDAALRSAVLGLAAYGAYNLTNMAIIRGWPVQLSLIDWTWGGVVTALAGSAGYWASWGRS